MASQATLICKECNYENEIQRIHCHQCGRKLERSAVFEEEQRRKNEREQAKRVEERKKLSRSGSGRSPVGTLLLVLIRAALTAAVILAAWPPAEIPSPEPQLGLVNPQAALAAVASAPAGRQIALSQDSINEFLRTNLRPEKKPIPFERIFATLEEGKISFTLQHGWPQYSIYNSITYTLAADGGQLVATPVGASFGRLNLPARLAPYAERLFHPIWKNFATEQEQMNHLQSIKIHKEGIVLTAKGAVATGPAVLQ